MVEDTEENIDQVKVATFDSAPKVTALVTRKVKSFPTLVFLMSSEYSSTKLSEMKNYIRKCNNFIADYIMESTKMINEWV